MRMVWIKHLNGLPSFTLCKQPNEATRLFFVQQTSGNQESCEQSRGVERESERDAQL